MGKYNVQEEKDKVAKGLPSELTEEQFLQAERYGITVLYTDRESMKADWDEMMQKLVEMSSNKNNGEEE